jgi:hypothetical protein
MKTHIRDVSQAQSGDDLESVLEVLLGEWAEIDDRWSSRLEVGAPLATRVATMNALRICLHRLL